MTEGNGETRLSDQIAYHRSLCDAAAQGNWFEEEDIGALVRTNTPTEDAAFIAAHSPDVVSALLDVALAAEDVDVFIYDQRVNPNAPSARLHATLAALSQRMEERPAPAQPEEAP